MTDPLHPEQELTAYAMDDLPEPARGRVAAHLDGCARCRTALAESRAVLAGLADGPPAPPLDRDRYAMQLRAGRQGRPGQGRLARVWPAAAAAIVAAIGLLLALHALDPGREPTRAEETTIATRLPLLREYRVVERLDLLEDLDAIRHLDRVAGAP